MDLRDLIDTVGLWPALVLLLGWWVDKIRREQIGELKARNETLEEEAKRAVEAKDRELDEWKQRALEARRR